jgi:putative hemolysin
MITIIQKQSALSIRAGNLEVKLASNLTEIDAAMRLRFEVFNL